MIKDRLEELTVSDYQDLVDEWINTLGVRYFSELTNLGILMEEVGEVARIMPRTYWEHRKTSLVFQWNRQWITPCKQLKLSTDNLI